MRSTLPGHVSQLLEGLAGLPAYVIGTDWHILGWSRTFAALYPNVPIADEADRNLLWLVFMDPSVREMWSDWEQVSWLTSCWSANA